MRPLSACTACRDRRKKCDRARPGLSCKFCVQRGLQCLQSVIDTEECAPKDRYEPLVSGRIEDGRLRAVSSALVPDAALCEELVELYFRYAHVAFHNIFHRPTFMDQVGGNTLPKILFFGVASLSARYSTHSIFAHIAPWDRGRPYRDEAKRLLDVEDTSLTSIQACMLLAANASVEGRSNAESVYLGIALRMATLLNLPTIQTDSLLEQEINRRVWWSLVTTETWTSASQSLPRILKPRESLPLPMDERQFLALDYEVPISLDERSPGLSLASPSSDHCDSLVAQMIRLNILLYDIFIMNARLVAKDESMDHEQAHILANTLDDWANGLPLDMQYSEDNLAYWVEESLGAIFIILHINYNHAGQLLFYQSLHSAQDDDQSSGPLGLPQTFSQRCKQHAMNLCDIAYHAKQKLETVALYPLAGHILCLASTVQIHTLLFGVDNAEISACKTRLERNFEMIYSMNEYWPINYMSIKRLERFHAACLRSRHHSFRLDAWMLSFLLGFTHDVGDRDLVSEHGHGSKASFDDLRQLLDM